MHQVDSSQRKGAVKAKADHCVLRAGIGLAFCKLALSSSARVIIADLKLNPDSERLVHENSNVSFYKCDVRNWKELEALIPYSEAQFGDVPDVYAANAGVGESVCHQTFDVQGGRYTNTSGVWIEFVKLLE